MFCIWEMLSHPFSYCILRQNLNVLQTVMSICLHPLPFTRLFHITFLLESALLLRALAHLGILFGKLFLNLSLLYFCLQLDIIKGSWMLKSEVSPVLLSHTYKERNSAIILCCTYIVGKMWITS